MGRVTAEHIMYLLTMFAVGAPSEGQARVLCLAMIAVGVNWQVLGVT